MVTTIAVRYPNGRIPTSVSTIPAKIIKSQALTKNSGPAAMSLKNASTINHRSQLALIAASAAAVILAAVGIALLIHGGTSSESGVQGSGSGLIQVTATTSLDAAVPGTGAIVYSGNPPQVTSSVTGNGTVTRG
jgi:hypothetical protein